MNLPRSIKDRRYAIGGSALGLLVALVTFGIITAADHDEAPIVQGDQAADLADIYAFQSPGDPDNVVLALTLSDAMPPGEIQLNQSIFDPDVLYELKFDSDGDAVEDLVIQAFVTGGPTDQVMHFRGPAAPSVTGARSRLLERDDDASVAVTRGTSPVTATGGDMTVFAGLRDDPFFFDVGQFVAILNGQATGFNDPGTDSFANLNVYAIVIELPKSRLGDPANLTMWGVTSRM